MAWSDDPAPGHWPSNVKKISIDQLDRIGIDPGSNTLYWDGQKIVTIVPTGVV